MGMMSPSQASEWFDKEFPDYSAALTVRVKNFNELADALSNKMCDGTMAILNFEELQRFPTLTTQCDLKRLGEPFNNVGGGFMVFNDHHDRCTGLVRDVLTYHYNKMVLAGIFSSLKNEAFDRMAVPCPEEPLDDPTEPTRLSWDAMGGILSLHGIVCGLAFSSF